jgi:hypothetical protein
LADPCPEPNAIDYLPPLNCADDCFDQRRSDLLLCGYLEDAPTRCTNYDPSTAEAIHLPKSIVSGDVLLRTPSAVALRGPCACDKGVPIAAKLLFYTLPDDSWPYQQGTGAYHIYATVRPPWHLGLAKDAVECAPSEPAQCQDLADVDVQAGNHSDLQIWTEDAAAPPVNVEMAPGDCPQ